MFGIGVAIFTFCSTTEGGKDRIARRLNGTEAEVINTVVYHENSENYKDGPPRHK